MRSYHELAARMRRTSPITMQKTFQSLMAKARPRGLSQVLYLALFVAAREGKTARIIAGSLLGTLRRGAKARPSFGFQRVLNPSFAARAACVPNARCRAPPSSNSIHQDVSRGPFQVNPGA